MGYFTTDVPNLASEVFDDEVVVANFVSGSYFSLTGSASSVWQALRAGKSTEEVSDWLGSHFGLPVSEMASAVQAFVDRMIETGLVAPVETVPAAQPLPELRLAAFSPPQIEQHDDLQDLLLLDPVHDVAQAGWPHLPTDKG